MNVRSPQGIWCTATLCGFPARPGAGQTHPAAPHSQAQKAEEDYRTIRAQPPVPLATTEAYIALKDWAAVQTLLGD